MNPLIASMIRASGRSWWQARYSNGKTVAEWDTLMGKGLLPVGLGRSSRWEEVSKKDMVGLRLLCPNGMAGELEAPEGFKFFQLKVGYCDVAKGANRSVGKHIIGVVTDADGNCLCRAWDYKTGKLLQFNDNIHAFKFEGLGKLSLNVQGLRI